MILYNKLPDRDEASVMKEVLSREEVAELLSLLPPRETWYSFETTTVSRSQSRSLSACDDPKVINIINTAFAPIGLTIEKPLLHPRLYRQGDFMDWHSDYDHLPFTGNEELYECTLVLMNTSDSVTRFKHKKTLEVSSYFSNPGDVLVVRRHGISHSVSEITNGGERMMIKISCSRIE